MNATPLIEVMAREAAQECAAIRDAARLQADRIRAEAKSLAAQRHKQALAALDAELEHAAAQARQRAEAEAHMVLLTAKDTLAGEVLADVEGELGRIADSPEFANLLPQLLEELLDNAEGGSILLVPPKHEELCRAWLADHGHGALEVRPARELRDGVAIQDERPTFRITNTLSARFAKQTSGLRKFCLAQLFPGQSAPGGEGDA